jgi:hypothetical protein
MAQHRFGAIDANAASIAGLVAGVAFLAVLEVDTRLTGRNVDDRILLAGPFVRDPARARVVGTAMHLANSVALAWPYAAMEPRIPGPPWWKGVLFFNAENLALYPLLVFRRRHPSIRAGVIDDYWTWSAFLQSIPRHVAFGAVLGVAYDRLRRR